MATIKLHIDELTKKVTGFTSYPIDEELDDYLIDVDIDLLIPSMQTNDLYFINGELIIKERDIDEHHNNIGRLEEQISTCKTNMDMSILMDSAFSNGKGVDAIPEMYLSLKTKVDELQQTKDQLVADHETEIKEYFKRHNRELDDSVDNKYYSSICLLIKDENEYLIEWLEWHLNLGIEHFYIYDNDSEIPVSETIMELLEEYQDKITVVQWSGSHEHMQHDCYNHCLKTYGDESTWIAFIDSDEFIRLTGNESDINAYLKNYEEYGTVSMLWILYNANGAVAKENLPVRERFTYIVDHDEAVISKIFLKPVRTKKMLVHWMVPKIGSEIVNGTGVIIDHYYTKSYEEWCNKILRGSCDPDYRRKYDEFFKYNPNMTSLYDENFLKEQGYE